MHKVKRTHASTWRLLQKLYQGLRNARKKRFAAATVADAPADTAAAAAAVSLLVRKFAC